jgi:anti-sigma regulatory factor (Ser/Thr protein kinase)
MPCDLGQVRGISRAAHEFLANEGCNQQESADCELALVEACNNAIVHAGKSVNEKPILVEVLCAKEEIEMRVMDQTKGFDWPQKASLPKADSSRGRGVFLMQTLMDYTNYFRSEHGNILVLRKKRKGGV